MRNSRLTLFILGLGLASLPASATITYSACDSGCTDNGTGTYSTWQAGGPSLTFTSLLAFSTANLSGGVYTDPVSGVKFTNYTTSGNKDNLNVTSGFLIQSAFGTGSGIEITLPTNTFAIALNVDGCSSTCGSFLFMVATGGLGTHSSYTTPYNLQMPSGASPHLLGIVSDTALTSIFIASGFNNAFLGLSNFEIGTGSGTNSDLPEPSTVGTVGIGFAALYFWHRRRRLRHDEPIR